MRRKIQKIITAAFIILVAVVCCAQSLDGSYGFGKIAAADSISFPVSQDNNCLACHQKSGDHQVELFSLSTHSENGITCNRCHGGDPSATDKEQAHTGKFIGKPSGNDVLAMCGSCHRQMLAMFKTSRHFPEQRGTPRMDCVACHGAHTVGSPTRNFSFAYYCTGCHGLEYLPALPVDFQKMLTLVDDLTDFRRALKVKGQTASDDVIERRKEIRRMVAEIVHPTDLEGGLKKIPHILELGSELKKEVSK